MANSPKDEDDGGGAIIIILGKAKKFIAENPTTVTFVCGILTGVILVWVL